MLKGKVLSNKHPVPALQFTESGRRILRAKEFCKYLCLAAVVTMMISIIPCYATSTPGAADLQKLLEQMVGIIGTIFVAVGIVLATYAVGQLVLAFKNEDPDSKSRSATLLVVSIVLISIKPIISGLGLTKLLK